MQYYSNNYFVESNSDEVKNINYDAFLAAVLLTTRKISIHDLNKLAHDLQESCNLYIYSTFEDFCVDIYCNDIYITLGQDYDEIICNNGRYMTVRDYLYSVIDSSIISSCESYIEAAFVFNKVKEFFGLPLQMKPKFILRNYIPVGTKKAKK